MSSLYDPQGAQKSYIQHPLFHPALFCTNSSSDLFLLGNSKDAARIVFEGFFGWTKIPKHMRNEGKVCGYSLCMVLIDKSYLKKKHHILPSLAPKLGAAPSSTILFKKKPSKLSVKPSAQFRPLSFLAQFPNQNISLKLPTSRMWWPARVVGFGRWLSHP